MKQFDLRSLLVTEVLLLIMIGFLSLDFLPGNYNEFHGICAQTWPKDQKQFEICMQPYFRQTGLDKYAIGGTVAALIIAPVVYIFGKRQK